MFANNNGQKYMRKYVRVALEHLDMREAARVTAIAFICYPEQAEKFRDKGIGEDDDIPFPLALIKYVARDLSTYSYKGASVDKLEICRFNVFMGKFEFCASTGGFVPSMPLFEGTLLMNEYYSTKHESRVKTAWESVKKYLQSPDGSAPILVDRFDDQHLYFMENTKTGDIKIGISVAPEVRRKQVQRDEGTAVRILHIHPSGGRDMERKLHKHFHKFRKHGEWFLGSEPILNCIKSFQSGKIPLYAK